MSFNPESARLRKLARAAYVSERESPLDECGYCHDHVLWSELLCPTKIIDKGHRYITYMVDGERVKTKTATIEHIVPLAQNGGNRMSNLMAACWWCNNQRSSLEQRQRPTNGKLKQMSHRGKYKRYSR